MGDVSTILPPLKWLPEYQARWLPQDATAGFTLAAYAIPVSMAYAELAGLPTYFGIYCYLLGGLCYAALGTSRQLAIGPTSAISLLVGVTVAGMAGGDASRWSGIAALTALSVAALALLAWLFRLSGLVSFISETILVGFKAGAALAIAMTQLPKLFGVKGGGENFFDRAITLLGQLGHTNLAVLAIGLAALALIILGERYLPGRPVALFVVALATVAVSLPPLAKLGISTVGPLPAGLPQIKPPSMRFSDVDGVFPLACACFLLSYIESISAARTLAAKNDYEVDARQELLALAGANLAVAFGQGFPVAGGLSQSVVNEKAGARTPLVLVFASLTLAACLLFLTGLLRNLPNVVLAAVVLVAIWGLIDFKALRHLQRVSKTEFRISLVALAGVLVFGILKGVLLAAIVSLLMLLAAVARPHIAFLGRIPGTRRYSDLSRHGDNETSPRIAIFRVESSVLYFNSDYVRQVVWPQLQATPELRVVVCDLSESPSVDVAGARMLSGLHRDLAKRGALLRIVGAHGNVRDLLRAEGLEEQVGYLGRHVSLDQTVAEFEIQIAADQAEPEAFTGGA